MRRSGRLADSAGVVERDVEAAEVRNCGFEPSHMRGFFTDIAGDSYGLAALCPNALDQMVELSLAASANDHHGALGCKEVRCRPPYSRTCASNNGDLPSCCLLRIG